MRTFFLLALFSSSAFLCLAEKKVVSPESSAGNEDVDIIVKISMTQEEVTQKLGADPGKGIALLDVRVIPKTDKAVHVSPSDFILLAHNDGERSKPFDPGEIAGDGALIVTNTADGTKVKKTSSSIGFGGMMGGGSSPGNPKVVALSSKMDEKQKGNAKLLDLLRAKQLPEKEINDPLEGYLYFPLDGKHKLKDMAVLYRGSAGKLNLEFEH